MCLFLCLRRTPAGPETTPRSRPLGVEARAQTGAVAFQRTLLADRVRALEDPVLPGAETAEDAGFHRLRPGTPQIGLEPAQGIGRKAGALFGHEADFVVPVNLVIARGHQTERLGLVGIERRADPLVGARQAVRL